MTGQDYTLEDIRACQADDLDNCPTGLSVVAVDPISMASRTLFRSEGTDFRVPTVAAQVGDDIWVGSVKGDRIGVLRPAQHAAITPNRG